MPIDNFSQAFCQFAKNKIEVDSTLQAIRETRLLTVEMMRRDHAPKADVTDFDKAVRFYVEGVHKITGRGIVETNVAYLADLLNQFQHRSVFLEAIRAQAAKAEHKHIRQTYTAIADQVEAAEDFGGVAVLRAAKDARKAHRIIEPSNVAIRFFNANNPDKTAKPLDELEAIRPYRPKPKPEPVDYYSRSYRRYDIW